MAWYVKFLQHACKTEKFNRAQRKQLRKKSYFTTGIFSEIISKNKLFTTDMRNFEKIIQKFAKNIFQSPGFSEMTCRFIFFWLDIAPKHENDRERKEGTQLTDRETRTLHRRVADEFGDSSLLRYNQLTMRKKNVKFMKSAIHGWGLFAIGLIIL
jgi:CRISPR/Cas system CSM-associated protein Csm4 (group 5 of RAMP superfamily)